jgi:hypothetical protein
VLISQDRHEVYLTFAAFDRDYVGYVTGKAEAKVDTLLRMHQFGPFVISNVLGGQSRANHRGVIKLGHQI